MKNWNRWTYWESDWLPNGITERSINYPPACLFHWLTDWLTCSISTCLTDLSNTARFLNITLLMIHTLSFRLLRWQDAEDLLLSRTQTSLSDLIPECSTVPRLCDSRMDPGWGGGFQKTTLDPAVRTHYGGEIHNCSVWQSMNGHTAWFDPQTEKLEPHTQKKTAIGAFHRKVTLLGLIQRLKR